MLVKLNVKLVDIFIFVKLLYFSITYKAHLKIRGIHDHIYQKNRAYRKWSEDPVSEKIHKSIFLAFIFSLLIFMFLESKFIF